MVLLVAEAVGHAGEVVTDDAMGVLPVEALLIALGQQRIVVQVGFEEIF